MLMHNDHQPRSRGSSSLQNHVLVASAVLTALVGGLGWWSATTAIAGAIVAAGTVVVEGGTKLVQHPDGGVVSAIFVDNGNHVAVGDVLFRLEDTAIDASRNVILSQLRNAFARLGRVQGELDGATEPMVHEDLPTALSGADLAALLSTQRQLMDARSNARRGRHAQILEQVHQLQNKIDGLLAQRSSSAAQLEILARERADLKELLADGLVSGTRVNDLSMRQLQLEGTIGQIDASVAETKATIAEQETILAVESHDLRIEILTEQQLIRAEIAQLLQQQIAVEAQLGKLEVRAPIAGVVHNSIVHTVGGVIGAGETGMLIVPRLSGTAMDIPISPLDIEAVGGAHQVLLKFPGLDARNSPDLFARIESVSPDLTRDPVSGAQFYTARVVVSQAELDRLPGHISLVAGMPVEAFIETSERTVLDFLLKPMADFISRTFRED